MLGNLKRFHGKRQRLDVQTFTDPWGAGFTAEVLRDDHPDWERWKEENLPADRMAELAQEAVLEVAFEGGEQVPNGFRRQKKRKKSRLDGKQVVAKIREKGGTRILKAMEEDLGALRPGIASVLLRKLTIFEEGGSSRVATEEEKAEFLKPDPEYWVGEEDDAGGEIPYGGQCFGDAAAEWLLDCSERSSEYNAAREGAAARDLEPTPGGTDATGQA